MPGWIVRWGTVVLCGLFATLLVIAGRIHFPDVVNIPVRVAGPSGGEGFIAVGRLPAALASRILRTEKVIVSLEAYSHDRSGTLTGTIQRIVPDTTESWVVLYIVMNDGVKARICQGDGNAQIVTNNKTLLNRFFDKLTITKNN